jgi:PAS domain S-box-containing protein
MIKQELEELKKWMDSLDTFVAKVDLNGIVLFCNKAPFRKAAITTADVYGKYLPDTEWFAHSETERSKIIAFLQKARASCSTRIETNINGADDVPIPAIFVFQPIKDDPDISYKPLSALGPAIYCGCFAHGIPYMVAIPLCEISRNDASQVKYISVEGKAIGEEMQSRVELSQALQESEAKYRELVQNANSIILRWDCKGHVTFFNEYAQDFFGYSEDEILGRNVVGTIVPETDTSGRDLSMMIEDIGKHPERYIKNENENVRRNGERVWIAWTNKAILDDQGRTLEILSIGNDLTEHNRMDEALRQSEEKYRTLIKNIQDGVFVIQDAKIQFTNEAFARIARFTVEEITGRDFRSL